MANPISHCTWPNWELLLIRPPVARVYFFMGGFFKVWMVDLDKWGKWVWDFFYIFIFFCGGGDCHPAPPFWLRACYWYKAWNVLMLWIYYDIGLWLDIIYPTRLKSTSYPTSAGYYPGLLYPTGYAISLFKNMMFEKVFTTIILMHIATWTMSQNCQQEPLETIQNLESRIIYRPTPQF